MRFPALHLVLLVLVGLYGLITAPGDAYAATRKALHIQDPGDYAEVPHAPSLAPSEFTIELWIRVTSLGDPEQAGGEQTLLDKRHQGSGFNLRLAGTTFPLGVAALAEPGINFRGDLIGAYRWHHVASTQDADTLRLYVDGDLVSRIPNAYASATTGPLRIGEFLGYPGLSLRFRGELDEIRIWNRARSSSEIRNTMHTELSGSEAGLMGYWPFDEDLGTTISDQSPHLNHGVLHGGATLVASDAPVGFVPPGSPTGLRSTVESEGLRLDWVFGDQAPVMHNVYRGNTENFVPDTSSWIASVSAPDATYLDRNAEHGRLFYYRLEPVDAEGHKGSFVGPVSALWTPIEEDYLVGAYYYPWYGVSAHSWPQSYMRGRLVPAQPPQLGHYESGDPAAIGKHLDWMYEYGVDFLVSSWWGRESSEEWVLRTRVAPELLGRLTKFAVLYETVQLGSIQNGQLVIDGPRETRLVEDFAYIADTYFDHPNYLRYDGRPVVFMYLTWVLAGDDEQALARIKSELALRGHDLFLIGDEITASVYTGRLPHLDAVTQYFAGVAPSRSGGYALEGDSYQDLLNMIARWYEAVEGYGVAVIPDIIPGFNTRAGSFGSPIHPRQSGPGAGPTSHFEENLGILRPYADEQLKTVMITSWNEWHEDTQVEPTIVAPPTSVDDSGTGAYTGGYSYTGYGTGCLEVIQRFLGFDPGQVVLTDPPDGSMDRTQTPTLGWQQLPAADFYRIQLSESPSFSFLALDTGLVSGGTFTTDSLLADTEYFWRVRAQSSGGSGSWSAPFRFKTETEVPVRLAYLRAERSPSGAGVVTWAVREAEDHAGFHVCRETDEGDRIRITDHLLVGRAEYSITDPEAPPSAVTYWLEELGRAGTKEWHGPVRIPALSGRREALRLAQNSPNPMTSGTAFIFAMPAGGLATIEVLSIEGKVVARLPIGYCPPGENEVAWDGRDLRGRSVPSGVYFYRLLTDSGSKVRKLLVLR